MSRTHWRATRRGNDGARRSSRDAFERAGASSRLGFVPDKTIDLHGLTPEDAMELTRRTVETGALRGKTLAIVHGRGGGTLRAFVREYGAASPLVERALNGEDGFLPGGSGVTVFFL